MGKKVKSKKISYELFLCLFRLKLTPEEKEELSKNVLQIKKKLVPYVLLNSTELFFHIPDEGVEIKKLIKEIEKLRPISKLEVIESVLDNKENLDFFKKGDALIIKPKEGIEYSLKF
ncbi:MAG: hypothetical protein PHY40_01415 [Patescibacteria group bacterium]|jgi:hypothetical protein|nr:hypothetical protein [Patescibacteria group bacterium]